MVWAFNGKRKRVRRLLIGLTITAVVAGGTTWFCFYYVFKAVFAEVVPGTVYRSPQPSPGELRRWVDRYHIRTVICLRGGTAPEVLAEKKVAQELGVQVIVFQFNAGQLPQPDALVRLIGALETAPKPILLHCRQGVDRAGMASAVAALVVGKAGLKGAIKQLPWLRGNPDPDHVSDLIGEYKAYCENVGLNGDDPETFKKWAREVYEGEPQCDTQLVPRIPYWPNFASKN